ncbi:MAG: molybdopterin-binding protein [Syntrophobacteraceae bacterium]
MKTVPVREALGMVLCHDMTQIIPGEFKGPAFRKGHIVREEDLPRLLSMGKETLYVWELQDGRLHEDEAARRIARASAGPGIRLTEPKEGKVDFVATHDGLLKVDVDTLLEINAVDHAMLATLHSNQRVPAGKIVAGTRIIPLVIDEERIRYIESLCRRAGSLVEVRPFVSLKTGIVTTGNEVYHGRIRDKFGPVVVKKLGELGCPVVGRAFVPDSVEEIVEAIRGLIRDGAQMITVTGGMSVDPDDLTPAGIREAGGRIVCYGAPVLPGAMFMLAYIGRIPVLGLPGCVMYHRTSIFDLVLPRILAGEEITRKDIAKWAHGGLCAQCGECKYPDCGFGKGA